MNAHQTCDNHFLMYVSQLIMLYTLIVYSTCTIESAENEEVIRSFLAMHEEFVQETAGMFLPLCPIKSDTVQFFPQRNGIDGFFIARLRRKEA